MVAIDTCESTLLAFCIPKAHKNKHSFMSIRANEYINRFTNGKKVGGITPTVFMQKKASIRTTILEY